MKSKTLLSFICVLATVGVLLSACATATQPAATVAPTIAPTAAAEPTPAAKQPTELKVGVILQTPVDSPFHASFLESLKKAQAGKPHGLNITYDLTEGVAYADADRVLRQYADTGKYQIMWCNSSYVDAVGKVMADYPEILWIVTGGGNRALGGNMYWLDLYNHEPAYLAGIIAGKMTKSDVLGVVAAFPYTNVTVPVNGFISGAKSVNPDVKVKVAFLGSWYDPPKAKESATAQIATGADFIFAERFGVFDAAAEAGIYAFGNQTDQWELKPEVVLTSALMKFDGGLGYIIDRWWEHATTGAPYNAPQEMIYFTMKDGGSDLAPFHGHEKDIPQDVLALVEDTKAKILSGELEIPWIEEPPAGE